MTTRRWLLLLFVVTGVYYATARLGLSLTFPGHPETAVWPPTGIALVALVTFGLRVWPAIPLGALLLSLTTFTEQSPLVAVGIAAGNTLEAVVGAMLLQRLARIDTKLERVRDVVGLVVFGAMLSTTISATVGVASITLFGGAPLSAAPSMWGTWWAGDAMGDLVIAPLLWTWLARPAPALKPLRSVELVVLVAVTTVVSHLLFSGALFDLETRHTTVYAVFPLVLWAALRFTPRETATVVFVVEAIAVWNATRERGPFGDGSLSERLLLFEVFLAAIAVTALVVAAVAAQLANTNTVLAARSADLARRNEEVEAFVYIVSHDLRAPLVNLQGFAQELDGGSRALAALVAELQLTDDQARELKRILDDDIATSLRFITSSTTKFQRLIEALLALSRTGRQDFRSEPVALAEVVATTLDSLRMTIDETSTSVAVGALPVVRGDPTAIGQIVANLVTNAIHYRDRARASAIEIAGEAADGRAHFWVRDRGVGISEATRGRLFQVFQRLRPDLAAGEGIGLATVKRIVERLEGEVWVDSEPGVGSTFHVRLPAA